MLSWDPEFQVENEDFDFSNVISEDPMPHLPAGKVSLPSCIHRV